MLQHSDEERLKRVAELLVKGIYLCSDKEDINTTQKNSGDVSEIENRQKNVSKFHCDHFDAGAARSTRLGGAAELGERHRRAR